MSLIFGENVHSWILSNKKFENTISPHCSYNILLDAHTGAGGVERLERDELQISKLCAKFNKTKLLKLFKVFKILDRLFYQFLITQIVLICFIEI